MTAPTIYEQWLVLKHKESVIADERRELEDTMREMLAPDTKEGSESFERDGFKVKITQRLNRTIDGDMLQEIAAENSLTEHLSRLFRWKPSLDMRRWKDTSDDITGPLSAAITTKAGRPSFSIEPLEE